MFKSWSLAKKLIASYIVAATVAALVGLFAYLGSQKVVAEFMLIAKGDLPKANALADIRTHAMAVARNLALLSNPDIMGDLRKEYESKLKDRFELFDKAKLVYEELPFANNEEKKLFGEVTQAWTPMKNHAVEMLKMSQTDFQKNEHEIVRILTIDFEHVMDDFTKNVKALDTELEKESTANVAEALAVEHRTDIINLVVIIFSAIGMIAFGLFFSRALASSIDAIVSTLTESANQIASASTEVASSSESLSQASVQQAAALEETASALEEISSMIAKAAESSNTTASSSVESQQKAETGKSSVDQMMNSMDEISQSNEAIMNQVNQSNQQMAEIVKVIQEIGNKTKVINDIVFQTKLLSFNASVEAARAGEHGKGFAVVAEEVGNLAQMSGNAAKEISDMLTGSISRVEAIVNETKSKVESLVSQGKDKVEAGVNVAKQCAEVLNEIVDNVSKVSGLSQEISVATKEQAQGVSEINKAMTQLDTVTQQNSATSEEASSAAEQLSAQAESLQAVVRDLARTIHGDDGKNHAPVAAATSPVRKTVVKSNPTAKKSNVVHLQSNKAAKQSTPTSSVAVGAGGAAPDRDHDGFKDI